MARAMDSVSAAEKGTIWRTYFLNLFKWFHETIESYPSLNRVSKLIDNGLRGVCLKGINNITISRLLLERIASLKIFFRFISKWLSKMFQEIV
jgi:hypothetical protein